MLIIGLTGSIGMGKTTIAGLFREAGLPVHDADAAVHELYCGAAVEPVEAAFPGVMRDGRIDRALLGQRVLGDADALARLEAIIHPLVAEKRDAFLRDGKANGARCIVLDIPLLLETRSEGLVDLVCVVSAPFDVQKRRVLTRDGMTADRFDAILARQMPDEEKRRRAHVVVGTGDGIASARAQVRGILRSIVAMSGGKDSGVKDMAQG